METKKELQSVKDKILGGILGLCVGDALGVPVEFINRELLSLNPVTEMRGYGTHNTPPGTWSDDTSMTLCLMDSLINGLNFKDIMDKFVSWLQDGEYTPYGKAFGVGQTVLKALIKYENGIDPLKCGGTLERDNGNGSLMRILPLLFYLRSRYLHDIPDCDEAISIIHNVSALTHAHIKSQTACVIYLSVASELAFNYNGDTENCVINGMLRARAFYHCIRCTRSSKDVYDYFRSFRCFDFKFKDYPQSEIKSTGYVVDTLDAALWCLLNSNSYESCVLKAVNLGGDTDTIAAVAGGLAGLAYGKEAIPIKWLELIPRKDYIEDLCIAFYDSLSIITNEQRSGKIRAVEFLLKYGLTKEEAYNTVGYNEIENNSNYMGAYAPELPLTEFIDDLDEYNRILCERYEKCCESYKKYGAGEEMEKEILLIYKDAYDKIWKLVN